MGYPVRMARFGIATLLMTTCAAPAFAQSQPKQQPAAAQGDFRDEIVVTAQRREQSIMDVGASISSFDTAEIERRRIEQVADFAGAVPNVNIKEISPGTLPIITIRGIGLNDWSSTNNPSAGVYVDEVYISSLALMNFDLFDIERMEALKGPQGTLYGRNSTAGALNVLTAKPRLDEVAGFASVSAGNYDSWGAEAWLNAPLSDTLAVRLSAKSVNQETGFYYNALSGSDLGERHVLIGRAQLRWQPSDRVDFNLKVEGQRTRSEGGASSFFGAFQPPVPIPGLVCPGSPECVNLFGYSDTDGDPFTGSFSIDPTYDIDQLAVTLNGTVDMGWATLTTVTGYIDFERQWGADVDISPAKIADYVEYDEISQFSQELRLSGETGNLVWLAGAFYSQDQVDGRYDGFLSALFRTNSLTQWKQDTRSHALFGNIEYKVAPTVTLIAGLRHTWEKKDYFAFTDDLANVCPGSLLSGAPCGSAPVRLALSDTVIKDKNWSWRLGVNWKPSDAVLVYASASQGIKSGGFFSGFATNSSALLPYSPEKLIAYEIGLKARLGRDLSVAASSFYYDYSNMQTFIRDTSGPIPVQRLGNVGKARLYGLDLDAQYRPAVIPGLTLSLGLGLLDSRLGAFPSSGGIQPAGAESPNAPRVSLNLGAAQEFAVSSNWTLRLQGDGRYNSATWKDAQNLPLLRSESFWVWNGRVEMASKDGWAVALWAKNLSDARYVVHSTNLISLGFGSRIYGAPRTYGVTLSKHF